jgi:hypothetical protein
MPPQAYALFFLFLAFSVLLAMLATWLVGRVGGPRAKRAFVVPFLAAFGAFYLIGHRMGLAVGPEIALLGFQVALFGDLAIGFAAALLAAGVQALIVRARSQRSPAA